MGFIGCGTISAAMIDGLMASGFSGSITVSPRSVAVAADLARRHAAVRVATDNQAVLDTSDTVVLAVRPQIVADVLATLHFRTDHRVLSLVAAVTLRSLRRAVAPAIQVIRAVPLPAVARRQGATAVFPPDAEALALFDALGSAIALEDEGLFSTFSAVTAIMSSYFAAADVLTGWMTTHGAKADDARAYVAAMLRGLASAAEQAPHRSFAELSDEHQTRGGLNEQVRNALDQAGACTAIGTALDAIAARLASGSGRDGN